MIKFTDLAKRDSHPVVVDRSGEVGLQVGEDFARRVTSCLLCQTLYFSLELLLTLGRPLDLLPDDAKAEEGRFVECNNFAFGFVDDEFEGLLQVVFDTSSKCADLLAGSCTR